MIIGIVTLITMLFFGSFQDTFLIPGIEKSVKEYVLDDERKADILSELKLAEKEIKHFLKIAKADMKSLQEYNLDRDATLEQFNAFYEKRKADRSQMTTLAIDRRIRIQAKITDDEWASILLNGEGKVKEQNEKLLKKEAKGNVNDVFEDVRTSINEVVQNAENRKNAMTAFEEFRSAYREMERAVSERHGMRNDVVKNRTSTKEELQALATELNEYRKNAYDELVKFHFKMIQTLEEEEWNPVMKRFNRILG